MKRHIRWSIVALALALAASPLCLAQGEPEQPPAEGPDVILAFAQGLIQKAELDMAIGELQKIVKLYPDFKRMDAVKLQLGVAHFRKKEFARARDIFLELKNDFPESDLRSNGLYMLGNAYFMLNAPAEAAATFLELYARDDRFAPDALFYAANNLITLGQKDQGTTRLREYIAKYPDGARHDQAVSLLVDALTKAGDHKAAAALLSELIEKNPDAEASDRYRLQYARTLAALDRADEARGILAELMKEGKAEVQALAALNLGWLLYKENKKEEAGRVFARTAELSSTPEVSAAALFNAGASFHEANQHKQALPYLTRLLKEHPDYVLRSKAELLAGLSAFNLADHRLCVTHLMNVDAKGLSDEDFSKLVTSRALAHVQLGQTDQAVAFCEGVLKDSESATMRKAAYLVLAQAHAAAGRWGQAVKILADARGELDDSAFANQALVQEALFLFQDGKYEPSKAKANEVLKTEGLPAATAISARFRIGWCEKMQGNAQSAAAEFMAAYEQQKDGPLAAQCLFLAAESLRQAGQLEKAVEAFEKLRADFKDSTQAAEALLGLGMAAVQAEQYAEGERLLTSYLDVEGLPRSDNQRLARQFLATALLKQDRAAAAERVLNALLADEDLNDSGRVAALQSLAVALHAAGKPAEAAQNYLKAAELGGDNRATFFFFAGERFRDARQPRAAIEAYTKALAVKEKPPSAKVRTVIELRLGQCFEEAKRHEDAIEHYRKAIPDGGLRAYAGLARSLKASDQFAEAARTFLKINIFATEVEQKAEALYEAAGCFASAGKPDEAKKYYTEIVNDHPESPWAIKAEEKLADM